MIQQTIIRLILGDQLNPRHSWFQQVDDRVMYVMMEIEPEATYTTHHLQKLVAFFAAMRAFADHLREGGHCVRYFRLDDSDNRQSFVKNLRQVAMDTGAAVIEYQEPDVYRLDQELQQLSSQLDLSVKMVESEHFLTDRNAVMRFFEDKNQLVMEYFYRHMRRKWDVLMEGNEPQGGQWNFDKANRNRLPDDANPPAPLMFRHEVDDIRRMIERQEIPFIGKMDSDRFWWPINRHQALKALNDFLQNRLLHFGSYQDAMHHRHPFVFHSALSFAINTKMLSPLEVVNAAVEFREKHSDRITLAQLEGFVRQIIGWREYMRGIYWGYMPEYARRNALCHDRSLPKFYWSGNTEMNCLRHAITQSLELGYAHHIQRLMVTGNFALLLGVHPDVVDSWYLGIYLDAIEWVEMPNTRGMSQFADGGLVGTKPYVSSTNYINKMSDYCRGCIYNHRLRTGEKSCPFNALYWDFHLRHREKLENNPRIGFVYRNLARMTNEEKQAIFARSDWIREHADEL